MNYKDNHHQTLCGFPLRNRHPHIPCAAPCGPARRGRRLGRALLSLLLLFAAGVFHSSCDEHEPAVDWSLRVGNIYCYDGTVIPPEAYDEKRHVPIAVIVGVGGVQDPYTAIAVGMDEWQLAACDHDRALDGVGEGRDDMNGRANTAAMLSVMKADSTLNCPAADYASRFQKGDGAWYIPACGELRLLSSVRAAVSRTMEIVGGKPFSDEWYLSSSQDGTSDHTRELYMLNVSLAEGRVMSGNKTAVKTVRPFVLVQ